MRCYKQTLLRWLAFLGVVGVSACADKGVEPELQEETCTASVADYTPLVQVGDIAAHDPAAIYVEEEGAFYLFSTGHRIPIRRSTDLINWQLAGFVLPNDVPQWCAQSIAGVQFPWAPDISFFNGKYYLYYACSGGQQHSAIGVATNVTLDPYSPNYRWEDQGKVVETRPNQDPYGSIDPNFILDEEGNPWMVWGSYLRGIYLHRIDPATGKLLNPDYEHYTTFYHLAERPIERAIEAPFIVRQGNYYYLFVSFDACCQGAASTYRVMVGRSVAITGPYVDQAGWSMLTGGGTLLLQSYGRIRGPGHNGVFRDGQGRWFFVHHFYDGLDGGRIKMQVRSLLWRNGWPVVGEAYDGKYPGEALEVAALDLAGVWGYSVDYGQGVRLRLQDDGSLERCGSNGLWSRLGNWRVEGSELVLTVGSVEERLVLEPQGRWAVGRSQSGQVLRAWKTVS